MTTEQEGFDYSNLPDVELTEAAVLAAAREKTGLSDFGDEADWKEGFTLLREGLNEDARLSKIGRIVAFGEVLRHLENRLRVTDDIKRNPEILQVKIEKPVSLMGLPRTGSTSLHDLMAQDPDNRVPMTWECNYMSPPPEAATYDTDPRIADCVAHLERTPGGVDLYLPYGRTWQKNLVWLVFGVTFGGFGLLAGRLGAPLLFPLVFGGVGGAFTVWAFFALGNSLKVQFSPQGLRTERRLLGFMLAWHQVPRSDLQGLQLVQSYTSQSGSQHTVWYRIRVALKSGKTITVADSLRGEAVAEQMLQQLAQATGLPVRAD